jgi:hypothetical protein
MGKSGAEGTLNSVLPTLPKWLTCDSEEGVYYFVTGIELASVLT